MIRVRRFWPHSGAASPVPALDGLRALAVLLTLLFHAWFIIPGVHDDATTYDFPINYARTGVQLFFVLSGFLLFQPYARWALSRGAQPSTKVFYVRRLRRIAPAYWANLAVLAVMMPLTPRLIRNVLLHVVWLQNLGPAIPFTINTVYWTMSVEVQFYIILPLCAAAFHMLVRRLGIRLGATLFFGALFLISPLDNLLVQLQPALTTTPIVNSFLFSMDSLPYWLAVFACGMCLRVLIEARGAQGRALPGYGALAGALILALSVTFLPALHHILVRDILFGPAYAALIYATLSLPWLTRLFSWNPLRLIGLISYSLYLWHYIIIRLFDVSVLGQVRSVPLHVLLGSVLAIVVGVPFAYVWYQIIERPFLVQRPSSGTRSFESAPAIASNIHS